MKRRIKIAVFGKPTAGSIVFENRAKMSEQLDIVKTLSICGEKRKERFLQTNKKSYFN